MCRREGCPSQAAAFPGWQGTSLGLGFAMEAMSDLILDDIEDI
jgi:hypothetical protein